MIVLTAEESEKIRGRSPKDSGAVLDPVAIKGGRFMLGEEVLDDPAHEDVRDFLASLPREPLEKLPIYTEEDEPPVAEEVASFKTRAAIWTREEIDAFRDNIPTSRR